MSRNRVVTDIGVYEADAGWAKVPNGWSFREVAGVATDSRSHVYVFSRSEHPMMVFDSDGEFLSSWGEGVFTKPHNVRVSQDGFVFCSDLLDHTVRKFTQEGELVMTLGTANAPSDTGGDGRNSKINRPLVHSTALRTSRSDHRESSTSPTGTRTQGCTSSQREASSSIHGGRLGTSQESSTCPTAH